ncbi:hypothetical protein DFH09DRAFT_1285175 [Mycena vulgaris]|nr:hypothetical protein DFH09DRAFT_1285175 [Mycena vulgaris]
MSRVTCGLNALQEKHYRQELRVNGTARACRHEVVAASNSENPSLKSPSSSRWTEGGGRVGATPGLRSVCTPCNSPQTHTEMIWILEYLKELLSIARVTASGPNIILDSTNSPPPAGQNPSGRHRLQPRRSNPVHTECRPHFRRLGRDVPAPLIVCLPIAVCKGALPLSWTKPISRVARAEPICTAMNRGRFKTYGSGFYHWREHLQPAQARNCARAEESQLRYSKAPLYLRVGLQLQGRAGHEVESEPEGEGELRGKRRVEELEDTALNSRHSSEGCEHKNGAEKVGDGEEASSERGRLKWRNLGEEERRRSQRLEIRALGTTRQTLVMSDAEFIARDLHALYCLHGEMDACNEPEVLNNKVTLAEIPDCAVGDIGRDIEIGGIVRSLRERGSAGLKKDHDSHLCPLNRSLIA